MISISIIFLSFKICFIKSIIEKLLRSSLCVNALWKDEKGMGNGDKDERERTESVNDLLLYLLQN